MTDEPHWRDDPNRAQEMATVTGSHPDTLDQVDDDIHAATIEPGQPPHPADTLRQAAAQVGRYARRTIEPVAGRVIGGIVVPDEVAAATWFAYMGATPLGTDDAIDRVCRRHIHHLLTLPIRPELGTLVQELRERRATQTGDLPEIRQ